jgi:hypothetical protein
MYTVVGMVKDMRTRRRVEKQSEEWKVFVISFCWEILPPANTPPATPCYRHSKLAKSWGLEFPLFAELVWGISFFWAASLVRCGCLILIILLPFSNDLRVYWFFAFGDLRNTCKA